MKEIIDKEAWKIERGVDCSVLQVRVHSPPGTLHLQGYGEQITNRPYGFAMKFSVPEEVTNWLSTQTPEYMSFASEEKLYIRNVSINEYKDGYQIEINTVADSSNGEGKWILDLHQDKINIKELLDFANNNELITPVDDNRWIGDD